MAKRGYTKQEANRRRMKFQVLEGMGDFLGTVLAFVVILLCIIVITTLITWLRGDLPKVIDSILKPLMEAFG